MHGKIKKVFFRVIHYAIMVMITVLMLMPIGWMLGTSMRQSKESFVLPPSLWQLMLLHELILKEKIFFLYLCWRV